MITIHFPTGKKVVLPTANFLDTTTRRNRKADDWKFYTRRGGELMAVATKYTGAVIEFQTNGGTK